MFMTANPDLEKIRVVVCDDVLSLRNILRGALGEEPDVEVVAEADNGIDGLRLVAELQPEVVLLDLSMPELDGLQMIPMIVERSPDTGIIVLSGFAADPMRATTMELGADCYLEKGESLDAINAAVREVVEMRRAVRRGTA
jgi:DNA-binding NarL/FixJ family response regulator